jgi:hypothetical protein
MGLQSEQLLWGYIPQVSTKSFLNPWFKKIHYQMSNMSFGTNSLIMTMHHLIIELASHLSYSIEKALDEIWQMHWQAIKVL